MLIAFSITLARVVGSPSVTWFRCPIPARPGVTDALTGSKVAHVEARLPRADATAATHRDEITHAPLMSAPRPPRPRYGRQGTTPADERWRDGWPSRRRLRSA
jgi:hypothetical protein